MGPLDLATGDGNGNDAVFYLTLFESGRGDQIITTCHYFNITAPEVASTTSAPTVDPTSTLSSPSLTSLSLSLSLSPSPSSSAAAAAAVATPPTLEPEPNPHPGPSTGAVAGIAVGATLASLLVLGGLGFLAWRHFSKKKSTGKYTSGHQAPPLVEEYYKPPVAGREWNRFSPPPQYLTQGPRDLYEVPGHPLSRSQGPVGPYETYEAPGHPVSRSWGRNGLYEAG